MVELESRLKYYLGIIIHMNLQKISLTSMRMDVYTIKHSVKCLKTINHGF